MDAEFAGFCPHLRVGMAGSDPSPRVSPEALCGA